MSDTKTNDAKTAKINRLNRVAGQVRGLAQMIEDDRYCMDILHQMQAVKSALAKVETQVLKDHAACCVAEAIASGDEADQRPERREQGTGGASLPPEAGGGAPHRTAPGRPAAGRAWMAAPGAAPGPEPGR